MHNFKLVYNWNEWKTSIFSAGVVSFRNQNSFLHQALNMFISGLLTWGSVGIKLLLCSITSLTKLHKFLLQIYIFRRNKSVRALHHSQDENIGLTLLVFGLFMRRTDIQKNKKPSYPLPLIFRHGPQLVCRHKLLQHLGNPHKLALVIPDLYPEEQSCKFDNFLFFAIVIATQVLGQLLEDRQTDRHLIKSEFVVWLLYQVATDYSFFFFFYDNWSPVVR